MEAKSKRRISSISKDCVNNFLETCLGSLGPVKVKNVFLGVKTTSLSYDICVYLGCLTLAKSTYHAV